MFDRSAVIRLVEDALDRQPVCPACHRRTTIHEEADALYLECPAVHPGPSLRARISASVLGHHHEPLLALEELRAA